jgi:hypothetical protein
MPEAQMSIRGTPDIKGSGVGKLRFVKIGCAKER